MKPIKIVKSIVILTLIFMLSVTLTYAWISYSDSISGGPVSSGSINYSFGGDFISESEIIYPEKNLVDSTNIFSVNNQSTIDTSLRLKITYTLIEEATSIKTYKAETTDDLVVVFEAVFVQDGDYWYYIDTDHVINTTGSFDLISSIYYDGFKSSNEYKTAVIEVNIIVQIKQADHVSWTDLTSYNFNTGNPA